MTTTRTMDAGECVCGHARAAHEHLRRGTDCSLCAEGCAQFRSRGGRRHVLNLMLRSWHRGLRT